MSHRMLHVTKLTMSHITAVCLGWPKIFLKLLPMYIQKLHRCTQNTSERLPHFHSRQGLQGLDSEWINANVWIEKYPKNYFKNFKNSVLRLMEQKLLLFSLSYKQIRRLPWVTHNTDKPLVGKSGVYCIYITQMYQS